MDRMTEHTNHVVGDNIIIWGGNTDGSPRPHNSEELKSSLSKLTQFNISLLQWDTVTTTGTPPLGSMKYGSTSIGNNMYTFGGTCGSDCCHNELHCLNTTNKVWRAIPTTAGPMKKCACALMSYSYQGSDYLLALGGEGGKQLPTRQQYSLYVPNYGYYYTNEVHIMNITTSPGQWVSPLITGDRPPPMAGFTINVIPKNKMKAIIFGGKIVTDGNKSHYSNDLYYIMALTDNTVNFVKRSPQSRSLTPKPRVFHSSTIINNGLQDYLLIIGGEDSNGTIADCWILDMATGKWKTINVPNSVCGRQKHSVSSIKMTANTQWIIITGGRGMTSSPIRGVNVTMIIAMEYNNNNEWIVNDIWNSTKQSELIDRRRKHISPITASLTGDNHSTKDTKIQQEEIVQLRQQLTQQRLINNQQCTELRDQLQQKNQAIRQKDANILQTQQQVNELGQQLQQKDAIIQQQRNALQELNYKIQSLNTQIRERDNIIVRNDTTIAEQQQITRYRDNSHWVIQREEVTITQDTLGRGGWGEVRVGVFRGTKVAVKSIHEVIRSDYYLDLFSSEMEIASRIRHPNLLQFIGATKEMNLLIVTELMPTSLRNELEKNPLLRSQIISIAIDLVSALNYLHMWRPQPIIHRDVSSANVLLQPLEKNQWRAKLSDYGSVNLQDNIKTANPGSPVYSAPEASTPTLHSPAMDIFSFAIVLVEMSIRRFPSSVSYEREAQIREVKWPTIRLLISRCTVPNRIDRPNTNNILEELTDLYQSEYN